MLDSIRENFKRFLSEQAPEAKRRLILKVAKEMYNNTSKEIPLEVFFVQNRSSINKEAVKVIDDLAFEIVPNRWNDFLYNHYFQFGVTSAILIPPLYPLFCFGLESYSKQDYWMAGTCVVSSILLVCLLMLSFIRLKK